MPFPATCLIELFSRHARVCTVNLHHIASTPVFGKCLPSRLQSITSKHIQFFTNTTENIGKIKSNSTAQSFDKEILKTNNKVILNMTDLPNAISDLGHFGPREEKSFSKRIVPHCFPIQGNEQGVPKVRLPTLRSCFNPTNFDNSRNH